MHIRRGKAELLQVFAIFCDETSAPGVSPPRIFVLHRRAIAAFRMQWEELPRHCPVLHDQREIQPYQFCAALILTDRALRTVGEKRAEKDRPLTSDMVRTMDGKPTQFETSMHLSV